jgi:hypothetical protein
LDIVFKLETNVMSKPAGPPTFKGLAAELARESIVTQCLARFLEQVIEEIHDTQIKPVRKALQDVIDAYDFCAADPADRGYSALDDAISAARKAISPPHLPAAITEAADK